MLCEMCGKDVPTLKFVMVEGTMLKLCGNCDHFGKEMELPKTISVEKGPSLDDHVVEKRLEKRQRRQTPRDVYESMGDDLVNDFHTRIRKARQKLGWSIEDLGKKINEKKSVIAKLESKNMHPDNRLIKKLEHILNIKLTELAGSAGQSASVSSKGARGITLGDLMPD